MMRYFFLAFILTAVAVVSIAGFRGNISRKPPIEVFPDMDRQPKLRPQTFNTFFGDRRSSQPWVEGTVARGARYQDTPVNTGMVSGSTNFVDALPVPVTNELMARGQQRFTIYCAPCHGAVGDGKGITSKYGMVMTANLQEKRIVVMQDGELFSTITKGKNNMGAYAAQLDVPDRWAVIAYLRALQRSRLANLNEVPEALRAGLK